MDTGRQNIIAMWLVWHFVEMPKFLATAWSNYLSFALHYFSIPLLAVTLFAPWRRYAWRYPKGFSPIGFFNVFISNMFSRIIGAICRLWLMVAGLFFVLLVGVLGAALITMWIIIPVVIMLLIFLWYGI